MAADNPARHERVAALAGLPHTLAEAATDVRAAVGAPGLIEVRIERAENVRLHREVVARVDAALAG